LSGTGTQAGDKIEAGAIVQTFCHGRSSDTPLYVGSVKTNIGHTEATAGLAGLLKSVMILDSGKIPPNLNFSRPNEQIPQLDRHIKVRRSSPTVEMF
jgi:acyl transferase domain-containing protein